MEPELVLSAKLTKTTIATTLQIHEKIKTIDKTNTKYEYKQQFKDMKYISKNFYYMYLLYNMKNIRFRLIYI